MLTATEKRELKSRAHPLKPVVLIGQRGITDPVLASISEALDAHQLVKVRLPAGEKGERSAQASSIAMALNADEIGVIGRVLILYRKNAG